MSTVRELVYDALMTNGAMSAADPLSGEDANVALRALQRMLGTWANQNLLLYETRQGTVTLVPGTTSYLTTLLSTGRPVSIDSAFLRMGNVDYPLTLLDNQTYDSIQFKSNASLPVAVYYDPGYPNSTLYFYPTPSAAYTAYITGRYDLIAGTITLDTVVTLPPGYDAAIVNSLAVATAPLFGRPVSGEMQKMAIDAVAWLKRTNQVDLVMETDLPFRRRAYNPLLPSY